MALTDEQRGPRAAWLYRNRLARFGPGVGGLEALATELRARGAYRAPDTIKGWEASDERAPIPPEVVPHLEEIFGDALPVPVKPVSATDLVTALAAQTAAISELVALIRPLVGDHAASLEVRLRVLEAQAKRPRRPAGQGSRARSAPPETVE